MSVITLIKLEYSKFKKNSVIGLLAIMFIVTMPTVLFIGKELRDLPPPLPSNEVFFTFPMVWDYLGYAGSWLAFFFLGLIAVFIVVNEISYKTFRQNIIAGMTRREYFLGKLYSIIAISALAAIYYGLIAIIIGLFHAETISISDAFDNSWAISRFFLMCMGYMSIGLFFGFIVRRSGVSVLLYIIYILMLESLLKWAVHYRALPNASVNFYPANSFEDLMPFPIYRFADMIPKKEIKFDFLLTYTEATVSSLIWIAIFIGLAYLSLEKRDM